MLHFFQQFGFSGVGQEPSDDWIDPIKIWVPFFGSLGPKDPANPRAAQIN